MPTRSNSSKLPFGDIVLRREVMKRAALEVSHKSCNGINLCKTKNGRCRLWHKSNLGDSLQQEKRHCHSIVGSNKDQFGDAKSAV
ncbi:hypothetical protein V6N12_020687 [Hibiscus sabdariffa]|uniref:Uncharacterized protein n=1 Tax=Hibiscus sabdariffa TaxID=183260 RepID=A0ABR2CYV3_9ROSI